MTGQQRNILAAMGVDVWIPRAMICQKKPPVCSWRDQILLEDHVAVAVANQQVLAASQAKPELIKHIEPIAQLKDRQPPTTVVEIEQSTLETPTSTLPKDQTVVVMQQAFTLEAYCLDQVIIVVESSQLSIQSSVSGYYHELKWPLPLENFRDGRGVHAYIQGFLDALALDKRILILGQLDFISHAQSMQLASLQEMIDQPLLKRRLWQLMLTQ